MSYTSVFGPLAQAVQDTAFFTAIRESAVAYPVIVSVHLTCIAIFGGMIVATDLRILGLALKSVTVTDVVTRLRPWKHLGFLIMISCGIMLAGSKMADYYVNPYFQLKITLLAMVALHALAFRRSVYRNTEALDKASQMPAVAKRAAVLSLCLWLAIMCCGRWVGYYDPDADQESIPAATLTINR